MAGSSGPESRQLQQERLWQFCTIGEASIINCLFVGTTQAASECSKLQ